MIKIIGRGNKWVMGKKLICLELRYGMGKVENTIEILIVF